MDAHTRPTHTQHTFGRLSDVAHVETYEGTANSAKKTLLSLPGLPPYYSSILPGEWLVSLTSSVTLMPFSLVSTQVLLVYGMTGAASVWHVVHTCVHNMPYTSSIYQRHVYKKIKNIKNVKRCRDGMPKSMQTR